MNIMATSDDTLVDPPPENNMPLLSETQWSTARIIPPTTGYILAQNSASPSKQRHKDSKLNLHQCHSVVLQEHKA